MAEEPTPRTDPTTAVSANRAPPEDAHAKPASVDPNKPEQLAKERTDTDPMRELLDRMKRLQPSVAVEDRELGQAIQRLVQQGADAELRSQPGFRHQVAYAFQDVEKAIGGQTVDPTLRLEMRERVASAPGLENTRMLALMATTDDIQSKKLVHDIRDAGFNIGRQQDQLSGETMSRIEALENRVRLSWRPAATADGGASGERPIPEQPTNQRIDQNRLASSTRQQPETTAPHPQISQQIQAKRSALDVILSGMRPQAPREGAPWDPPPTPMAERLTMFEKKLMETADEQTFERTLKSGRAALDTMQNFANGEGAAILNRVQEAAKQEPGGMAAVLSEMREGGRFAELRKQFSSALETDLGLANAYDRAASALQRYGQDRSMVQDIIGRRPDPTAITARFEKMDAEIGEAASNTPSRNDGNSMLDDLTKKAAELLQKAVDAVRSVFARSPGADAGARPSPSPSMG